MSSTLARLDARALHSQPAASLPSQRLEGASRFEWVASRAAHCSSDKDDVLDVLFTAARPDVDAVPQLLQPLWAEEALQRIHTMMRLLDARYGTPMPKGDVAGALSAAHRLGALYRSLQAGSGGKPVPASAMLRDAAGMLVSLFGNEMVTLRLQVDPLVLQPYRRRALVLAAGALVLNALLHRVADGSGSWITVSLAALRRRIWRLRVTDGGSMVTSQAGDAMTGVEAALADLLAGELVYVRGNNLITAEITFPLEAEEG